MHLVDEYDADTGFFFGTSTRSLLTGGRAVVLPARGALAADRAVRVLGALDGDQILVGAVPFADDEPAQLIVPEWHRWGPALPAQPEPPAARTVVPSFEPPPQHYRDAVAQALRRIDTTELSKVVLARSVRIDLSEPITVPALLRQLRHRQGNGFVFGCALAGGGNLVGGSPELLVQRDGDVVTAHPLAGSRPRTGDPDIDRRSTTELLASHKDRREHALVVDDIARALTPYCTELSAPPAPTVVGTPTMLHLGTRITGRLRSPAPSSLALAAALHPTPAVCGTPTATAKATISQLEGFDRGFYAGMVGWCDGGGNGQWAVTIRCAELTESSARLFAGAGIVAGSEPEAELAETGAKLATMLTALGADLAEEGQHAVHAVA